VDWSIITPRISCGGRPDEVGVAGLLRYGHTHVIDLRHTYDDCDLYYMNFAYLRNPTFDDGATKEPEWFLRSIRFALGALQYPEHRVYVGCHSGSNRAPSTVAAILMAQGNSRAAALATICQERAGCELAYLDDAAKAAETYKRMYVNLANF